MLLAIDVGNTSIKAATHDHSGWSQVVVGNLPTSDDEAVQYFDRVPGRPHAEICCSVVPAANEFVSYAVRALNESQVTFLSASSPLGIDIRYKTPETLGADRLANALAVMSNCPSGIVVDCGTATKFEVIEDGAYLGGAIMPGIKMAASSLVTGTAQLPQIELAAPSSVIGNDTLSALRAGVLHGHASAIDGMVERLQSQLRTRADVYITGGYASLVQPLCKTKMEHRPMLTFEGLLEGAKRLKIFA